jgi:TRAP-type C4-dicarboxylate transport system permease small subunit
MGPGREPFAFFDRLVVPVLGILAAVILFSLMTLTCIDVIGRYFFNRPVYGAFEITEMLLAGLIFSGLPLVTLRNDHVTVDLFDAVVPPRLVRIQHVLICLIGFVATGYLAWRLWLRAAAMVQAGETTAQLKFKIGYLTYGMSLLMALTAVALIVLMFREPRRGQTSEV